MNREHELQPEPGTIRVSMHPLDPRRHELDEPSFTRYFPDLPTYERVRKHLTWDYIAIEVWDRHGEAWQPKVEHTVYSGLWRGEKITNPPMKR